MSKNEMPFITATYYHRGNSYFVVTVKNPPVRDEVVNNFTNILLGMKPTAVYLYIPAHGELSGGLYEYPDEIWKFYEVGDKIVKESVSSPFIGDIELEIGSRFPLSKRFGSWMT